jgi:hypothetical protein
LKTIGKVTTLLASTALLMATTAVIPAEAANKAGARCTKANAKAKIGGENFVCTKNPISKSSSLVWVWADCLLADRTYKKGVADQKTLVETAAQTKKMLLVDIEGLKSQVAANEAEAKTWDEKAATYKARAAADTAKAAELKASAAAGGVTSVDAKFKTSLQVALLDKQLTTAEITQLATAWSTTADKVPFIIEFLSVEDRLKSAKSYELGAKNAERKAKSLRSSDLIDLKNRQIKSAESNVSLGEAQVASLKATRSQACSVDVMSAITRR